MKNNTLDNPGTVFIDGSDYKIGIHDLPFRFDGDSWVKSTKSKSEIKKAIAKKAEEEAKKRINSDKIL